MKPDFGNDNWGNTAVSIGWIFYWACSEDSEDLKRLSQKQKPRVK